MSEKSSKKDFQQATGWGEGDKLYALVVDDDSFPKNFYPVGTISQIDTVYEVLIEKYTEDDELSPAERKALLRAFKKDVRLYELRKQPEIHVPQGGILGTGIILPSPDTVLDKAVDKLSRIDPEDMAKKAGNTVLNVAETLWGMKSGNPFAWGRGLKVVAQYRKQAANFVEKVDSARKGALAQLARTEADGVLIEGISFVKGEWLLKPAHAQPMSDLSLLGQQEPEKPQPPTGSEGGNPPAP